MVKLPFDGEIDYQKNFFTKDECDFYFEELLQKTKWQKKSIKIFGKDVLQPRLMAWYGDPGCNYTYSGVLNEPLPWSSPLLEIKTKIEKSLPFSFNSALLNLYRDGQDSMGAHSDNEKELGENPLIASVSFGNERRMIFRHRKCKEKYELQLEPGSLLIMSGPTQHFWKHEIPKEKSITSPRINITLRKIQLTSRTIT